jgi:hypothetical protein
VRWLLFVLVACGAPPPPPAAKPLPVVVKPVPPPARVTCADAGVVLRGTVDDSRKAGPAKEAAIASACLFDKWSQEVLDCVGGIATADLDKHAEQSSKCLAMLSTEQRAALDTKLTAWTTTYENETWTTAEDERVAAMPPDIPCASIITLANVSLLSPSPVQTGEELDFALQLRKHAVLAACEQWPRDIRDCVRTGVAFDTCRRPLDSAQRQILSAKLAAVDAVMAKIAAAKAKPPATYTCKAVVAAHYSDAAWRGKAEPPKDPKPDLKKLAAERKTMIADSRRVMLDACTSESWNATLRACELVESDATCGPGTGRTIVRWGFPALGTFAKTGVPECDAYGQSTQAFLLCNQIPQATKDSVKQNYERLVQNLVSNPAFAPQLAISCKQGDGAVKQALSAMGCTP